MKKQIKRYGNTFVIRISPEQMRDYEFEENDNVEVTITKIEHQDIKKIKRRKP